MASKPSNQQFAALDPHPVNGYYVNDSPPPSLDDSLDSASVVASEASSSVSALISMPIRASELSKKARAGDAVEDVQSHFKYDSIDWSRLPGFTRPLFRPVAGLTVAMWSAGVPIERNKERYWLCLECHQNMSINTHCYKVEGGSRNVLIHLKSKHHLVPDPQDRSQLIAPAKIKRATTDLDADVPREQDILNQLASSFDQPHFQRLLIRWMVHDNVSFRQVESDSFGELIKYLSPQGFAAMPGRTSVKSWIMRSYNDYKRTVKEELKDALGKIHISFDLWTSGNCLSLNGIVAHFIKGSTTLTPRPCWVDAPVLLH